LTNALGAKDSVNVFHLEASFWHQRLSHISEKLLNVLAKKVWMCLDKCSHGMECKHTIISFKRHPASRKSELLELAHSNFCCLLKVKSFSGAFYFVTFIDDCFQEIMCLCLLDKRPSIGEVQEFHSLVQSYMQEAETDSLHIFSWLF